MIFESGGVVSRYNPIHPLMIITLAHGGFGVICFLRPSLPHILRAYGPFGDLTIWGIGLWLLCICLLLSPRASFWLMISELISAVVFFTIGGLLTAGVGVLPTATLIFGLGFTSLMLFHRSFGIWLSFQPWYLDRLIRPPAWLERRRWFQRLRAYFGRDDG